MFIDVSEIHFEYFCVSEMMRTLHSFNLLQIPSFRSCTSAAAPFPAVLVVEIQGQQNLGGPPAAGSAHGSIHGRPDNCRFGAVMAMDMYIYIYLSIYLSIHIYIYIMYIQMGLYIP